ncbi:MAG TPA: ABC transporter permease, partial [Candidatus Thermoplasmatota archaeon]|nr:ABC transporter permease [Candidatus Thermoplasmatota archaeon]
MIVPRAVILPLALLVALSTTTLLFSAGVGTAPSAFMGDANVVLGPASGEAIGVQPVDATLVPALRAIPTVRAASAEIYLPTVIDGRSVFARGVDFEDFVGFERARLVDGRAPQASDEAVVGVGLARQLGVEVGDRLVLPSPFARLALPFTVVGRLDSDTAARDELFVPLEPARVLGHLAATHVHLVRLRADDPLAVSPTLRSVAPTFTLSDVRVSTEDLVPG